MMITPILPETAPFSPAQRAWLNGFFAGVFGYASGPNSSTASQAAASTTVPKALPPTPEAEESLPWHDPALPMPDRLKLAEGKPYERVLMAAMAQLDCGACGYVKPCMALPRRATLRRSHESRGELRPHAAVSLQRAAGLLQRTQR